MVVRILDDPRKFCLSVTRTRIGRLAHALRVPPLDDVALAPSTLLLGILILFAFV
jgi:hypothetical protein